MTAREAMSRCITAEWLLFAGFLGWGSSPLSASEWAVVPPSVVLEGPEAALQLLVTETVRDGPQRDRTRAVRFKFADASVAAIDAGGLLRPLAEGFTELRIVGNEVDLRVPVEVRGLNQPVPVSFPRDVIPILTKARCNSGGCHGKAEGQNGFKLSVFGFDPHADYEQIAHEAGQRRISSAAPDLSLLLRKGSALVPHGGGRKLEIASSRYAKLRRWISEGARYHDGGAEISQLKIEPERQSLRTGESQQIQVTAVFADGSRRCVTSEAEFESNADPVARVDDRGLVSGANVPGEAAILVRYMGQVAVSRIVHPRGGTTFTRPPEVTEIDRLVWDKLAELGIQPSGPCDDATFLRRAALDVIGTLPTVDEARAFLSDPRIDKRTRLVDALLNRPEYADYWTQRWSDILRVDREKLTPAGAVAFTRWLRRQLAENRPYDEFVREIVTARGDTFAESPAAFFRVLETPEEISRSISQLFLGVRIECAQCHHHPAEKWGQDDYFALAGFFTGLERKPLPAGGTAVVVKAGEDLKHPRSGKAVAARALGAANANFTGTDDRRDVLADWMTAPENPYLARMLVNRLWAHYFGRGLVEPIDDMRATNPAVNEPLLRHLADQFVKANFDVRGLTRLILTSQVYQLRAQTNETNVLDDRNFSHALRKAMPAEVLLDAISQATGVPEKFPGWPAGYRAIQIWDNRMESYFFRVFGRPVRASVCECERSNEPSIAQALHLLNSPELEDRIESAGGRARILSDGKLSPAEIINELYLATLSRHPTNEEQKLSAAEFVRSTRREATADILWALLNSKEFLDIH